MNQCSQIKQSGVWVTAVAALLFLSACQPPESKSQVVYPLVKPVRETTPVENAEDAADDPAIWIHPFDGSRSLVLGTDKQQGLAIYNLNGQLVDFLAVGRLNNVDIRSFQRSSGETLVLAAATNRDANTIDLFQIHADENRVTRQNERGLPTGLQEVYGICMATFADGMDIFVNDKDGRYQHWQLNLQSPTLNARIVREFQLDSQPEGCVADEKRGWLYVGEEDVGVWKIPLSADQAATKTLISGVGKGPLVADVEGMSIYDDGIAAYLVVSSQGDFSYALFDLLNADRYVGSFRVEDNVAMGVDGSQETDGLDVTSHALSAEFPQGLLVVQDGFNTLPEQNQNFKYISWADIQVALKLP